MKFPISKYSIYKQRINFQTELISKLLEIIKFGNWNLNRWKLFGNYTVWSLEIAFFALILFLLAAKNVDAATINRPPLYLSSNNGLVGYWTMDGNNVNWATGAVTDSSGKGNTGFVRNMATSTNPAIGKIGQALNFDGVDDSVNVSNTISGIQTVGFWVKATTTQKLINFNGNQSIEVISGTITANSITSTIYVDGIVSSTIDTNWHYVTITTATGITGDTITIGKIGTGFLKGMLDEVRVYNRALSANEVKTLYNSGVAKFNVSPTTYLTDGLVGYWTMDGSRVNWKTGAVTDSSGRGNTGTITNMATSTGVAIGKIGQALNFDGSNDYVNMGNVLNLSLPVTFSTWVKPSSRGAYAGLFATDRTSGNTTYAGTWLQYDNTGKVSVNFGDNNGSEPCGPDDRRSKGSANTVLPLNQWTHVAGIIRGATNMTIYVNGVDDGGTYSGTGGNLVTASYPAWIGAISNCDATNLPFPGLIDDVRVYNRALSANEIATLYNSGAAKFNVSPTQYLTSGLVGYWTMDGSKVNWKTGAVTDSSGRGNTGTITNMATSTGVAIGKIGQALNFDGVDDFVNNGTGVIAPTTGFSICVWIYPNVNNVDDTDIAGRYSDNSDGFNRYSYNLELSNNPNNIRLLLSQDGSVRWYTTGASTIPAKSWTFVCGTWVASTYPIIYVNGINNGGTTGQTSGGAGTSLYANPTKPFTIGRRADAGSFGSYFPGLIDEVRVYNRALGAGEIQQLYNVGR